MTYYKRVSVGHNNWHFAAVDNNYEEHVNSFIDQKDVEKNEFFETIYDYNQEHYEFGVNNKSVAGLSGMTTNRLLFDFDNAQNVEASKKDASSLVSSLLMKGFPEDAIRVYFSGYKGFHVEVKLKERLIKSEVDNIIKNLSEGLESADYKILDENRLIRLPLTKNAKSGMYKIPLTRTELQDFSLHTIYTKAKNISQDDYDSYAAYINSSKPSELPSSVSKLKNLNVTEKKELEENDDFQDKPDPTVFLDFLTPAKNALLQGFFDKGERNSACMILASTLRHLRFDKETVYNILKDTLRKRSRRLGEDGYDKEELWKTVIEPVFSPSWKGGTYSEEQNKLLQTTLKKYNLKAFNDDQSVHKISDVNDIFTNFAKNIDNNTLKLGIPSFDDEIRITTSTLVTLLASPSAGKSSISFGILNTVSNAGIPSLFFSLDMAAPMVFQRLIQRHFAIKSDDLYEIYKKENIQKKNEIIKVLNDSYKNVDFCFKSGMTIEKMREILLNKKNQLGYFPKLVVVDYLECIQTPYSDSTAAKAYVASNLKDIANDFGICVFLLVQPAKASGDPSYELNSYTQIKGSSVIAEAATQVITLNRPGFNPRNTENDRFLNLTVVKNRMGRLGTFDFHWEGLTGQIRPLIDEEIQDLANLRARVALERSGQNEGLF